MLKSYKELSRWYGALEPDAGNTEPDRPDAAEGDAPSRSVEARGEPPPGDASAPSPGPADAVEGRRTDAGEPAPAGEGSASRPDAETELDGIPLRGNRAAGSTPSLDEPEGPDAHREPAAALDDHDLFGGADLAATDSDTPDSDTPASATTDSHVPRAAASGLGDAYEHRAADDPRERATPAAGPADSRDGALERGGSAPLLDPGPSGVRAHPGEPALLGADDPRADAGLLSLPDDTDRGDRQAESAAAQVTPLAAHRGEREPWEGDDRFDNYVPADLPSSRSEFVGGWSDWVGPDGARDDDRYDAPVRTLPGPRALREEARARQATDPGRKRAVIVLVIAVLLLVFAAVGVVFLLGGSGGDRAGSDAIVPTSLQFSSADGPGADCPAGRTGTEVRGAGRGGAMSGPDAVLAFQYAYYVERSGAAARQLVAPDAAVSPADVIQKGIDSIPPGTTHCVRIVSVGDNRYSVEVTEHRPGGAPATYSTQTVTTAEIGGRTLITGIAAG